MGKLGPSAGRGHIDLVTDQSLGAGALPPARAGRRQHEAARLVDVQAGDDTGARGARHDEEGRRAALS